jgi:hypothetical protein
MTEYLAVAIGDAVVCGYQRTWQTHDAWRTAQ